MDFQQHPLSAAYPAMPPAAFAKLVDSVRAIGVLEPVAIYDDMVLDGWHRYSASIAAGVECPTQELAAHLDPREFVVAKNGESRRHLTVAQLALAAVAVYQWVGRGGDRKSGSKGTECPLKTTAEISQATGVGERSIKQAKAVHANAVPEVIDAIQSNGMGLPKASAIAQLPEGEQAGAISKTLAEIKRSTAPVDDSGAHDDADIIQALHDENDALKRETAALRLAADPEALTRIQELQEYIRLIEGRRDGLLDENAELKRTISRLERQAGKTSRGQ